MTRKSLDIIRLSLTVGFDLLHGVVARDEPVEARRGLLIYLERRVPELGREDVLAPLLGWDDLRTRQRSP